MNDYATRLHRVNVVIRALYVTRILTALMWLFATVMATVALCSYKSAVYYGVLMLTTVLLMAVQRLCHAKLRAIRSEYEKRLKTSV